MAISVGVYNTSQSIKLISEKRSNLKLVCQVPFRFSKFVELSCIVACVSIVLSKGDMNNNLSLKKNQLDFERHTGYL